MGAALSCTALPGGGETPDEQQSAPEAGEEDAAAGEGASAEAPPTEVPASGPDLELAVTGDEEVVFDWTTDRCEDLNIPDIAARAFRDANEQVQLTIGHFVGYRMIGPDLNSVQSDCSAPINTSDLDPDPAMFNDAEWIGGLYTEDGQTIYAIIHNEYRGHMHNAERPGQCPSGDYLTCLDTSLTMAISTDGGASYHDIAEPPNHLAATLPYVFNDQGVPSGLRQPSNILKGPDGYFYVFSNVSDYPETPGDFPPQWACVMRTDNLDDPSSWRYWDGSGFNAVFVNPYVEAVGPDAPKCAPPKDPDLAAGLVESVTYNTVLEKYVAVGISNHPTDPEPMWGVYYSTSDDLIDWSQRKLLIELPIVASVTNPDTDMLYAFPVLLDPDSPSRNFDTTDDQFYLYITHEHNGGGSLDRDLVRFPVSLVPVTYDIPQWEFGTDGDVEGWVPEFDLSDFNASGGVLSMVASGDDPYMVSGPVEFPASDYGQLSISMKVSSGGPTIGQVFFVTDTDAAYDEAKSMVFDVTGDGEFHTYDLDMSSVSGWNGLIRGIRLDPVEGSGRTIEIDRIAVEESP